MNRLELRSALHKWPELNAVDWDVACCLHMPEHLRFLNRSRDQYGLAKFLRPYFNRMDRCLFKAAVKRKGLRLQRFVVSEYAYSVGWHCHFIAKAPAHLGPQKLQTSLRTQWVERIKKICPSNFQTSLFWSEPLTGNYPMYCLKQVFRTADDPFDGKGTNTTSIIDWGNTYL